MGFFCSFI